MNSRRWLELTCKNIVLTGILEKLPDSVPSIRELRIQNQKLNRILMTSPPALKLNDSVSVKRYRKEQGKFAARVGEQVRKLEKMVDQSFKQLFRQNNPMTNAEFQQWKAKFNAAMEQSVERMQKQVTDNATKLMTQGPSKPFGKIGRS